jgi:hypothetical protein
MVLSAGRITAAAAAPMGSLLVPLMDAPLCVVAIPTDIMKEVRGKKKLQRKDALQSGWRKQPGVFTAGSCRLLSDAGQESSAGVTEAAASRRLKKGGPRSNESVLAAEMLMIMI